MRRKIVLDVLLSAFLVFEMLYQLTGNAAHEAVGAIFAVCIIVHIALSVRWLQRAAGAIGAGELGKKQRRLFIVACLLAIDVIALIISSIIISQTIWDAGVDLTAFNPGNIWYPLHTVSAYAMCILVLGHLVMHWSNVADALKIEYDPSRREAISSALNGVVMVGGIALGIAGIMRAGFQASDFSISTEEEEQGTVIQGYREVNAETGEYTTDHSFEAASMAGDGSSDSDSSGETSAPSICPLCPRRCKLSAPRCQRPYEAGLI